MYNEQIEPQKEPNEQNVNAWEAKGEPGAPAEAEEPPKDPMWAPKELLEWLELFAYSVAAVLLIFTFICRVAVVSGPSMEKTLHEGQILLVSDLGYEPRRGDVIVFQSNEIYDNEAIVKRVIATEGQTVDIDFDTWTVTVDGVALEEDYVNFIEGVRMRGSDFDFPQQVAPGHIFVMGDNRNHSADSRSAEIGQVDSRSVLGKVLVRIFPLNTFGSID